jgi:hypothetical protein
MRMNKVQNGKWGSFNKKTLLALNFNTFGGFEAVKPPIKC